MRKEEDAPRQPDRGAVAQSSGAPRDDIMVVNPDLNLTRFTHGEDPR
jgi:hypothetical protein